MNVWLAVGRKGIRTGAEPCAGAPNMPKGPNGGIGMPIRLDPCWVAPFQGVLAAEVERGAPCRQSRVRHSPNKRVRQRSQATRPCTPRIVEGYGRVQYRGVLFVWTHIVAARGKKSVPGESGREHDG